MAEQIRLSTEQAAIVSAAQRGKSLRVAALAGTGKTTTLVEVAKALSQRRIRYLVFNRAQKQVAEARFRSLGLRVIVTTAHGLAWQEFGKHRYAVERLKEDSALVQSWIIFLEEKRALTDFKPEFTANHGTSDRQYDQAFLGFI